MFYGIQIFVKQKLLNRLNFAVFKIDLLSDFHQ